MLEHCQSASERWGGVNQLLDRWLAERKDLADAYSHLQNNGKPLAVTEQSLQAFCQLLMDYVSAWHFELHEQLGQEAQVFGDTKALAFDEQITPRLNSITESLVAFNDRYDNGDSRDNLTFTSELKNLGQLLHERFELEDCLIEVLHKAHAKPTA
ncbi:transcriptional regulator [Ventosimonas gracilis]|uniref:Transcriptional regulator n=1 Tax=Ventosimonas gracilis TaxID=1680762 RepID=A0A139SVQ8_9GAMM|nr:Rsd/AlgQ family anti-sigma factor [Ventosimonas gracilis]KXU38550.1 transcriptional regulator [Ventosimonas gracilis]